MKNKTFKELYLEYQKYIELKLKFQSVRSVKSRFNNYILPYFENYKIDDITPFIYLEWQKEIDKKGFSWSYKKTLHYSMTRFYDYLNIFYNYSNNVPKKVGGFVNTEIQNEMLFWNIKEYNKFIEAITPDDIEYKFFFEFLYFTGVRLGEANALTFNDVINDTVFINKTISKEFSKGERVITSTKTKGSTRRIKIDNILMAQINQLKDFYKSVYEDYNNNFFVFGGKKPLSPTTLERKKNHYCELAKVKRIRIHDFRHSHATLLLSKNIPISEISQRLGHSDINMTINTYSHLFPEYEKRVQKTLNSLHKPI